MRTYSRAREEDYTVTVDWNLGNRCNFSCQYCHPWFHKGNNPFPSLGNAKRIVNTIHAAHANSNRMVRFSFVGGEPTMWAGLPELCQHIRERAAYQVNLMTNGSADEQFWEELAPNLSRVTITHHEGRSDTDHLLWVAEHLRSVFVGVNIVFAMQPESFEISKEKQSRFSAAGFGTELQALYRDHTRRTVLLNYSPEQIAQLFPSSAEPDMVLHGEDIASPAHIIHQKRNSFTGMKCGIGTDQIVIDQDGTIRGGWCRVGGSLGNVHDGSFMIPDTAITCTKDICTNPLDLSVPKWEESEEGPDGL